MNEKPYKPYDDLIKDAFDHARKNPNGDDQAFKSVYFMAHLGLISLNYAARVLKGLNNLAFKRGFWNSLFGSHGSKGPKV